MDKRRSRRVSLMVELTYQIDGVAITKRVSDLSEGGIFVDTPLPSEVGSLLRARFLLDGELVEAEGKVAYTQPFIGMGVEFTRLHGDSRRLIQQFVARLSEPVAVS